MSEQRVRLNVVIFREGETWVAQGLEYNVLGEGPTVQLALTGLVQAFAGQVVLDLRASRVPLADVGQAPKEFWDSFERARAIDESAIEEIDETPEAWQIRPRLNELRVLNG